jgi:hypothetical protein
MVYVYELLNWLWEDWIDYINDKSLNYVVTIGKDTDNFKEQCTEIRKDVKSHSL